ncbi:CAAX protease self-immunity [Ruminococcaceae bacterium YAD3003]|nr:CAAX protease self-immunity [Ruminococcaceae bacterium YAD3003]
MKSLRGIKAIVGSFFRKRGDLGAQASMASFFTTIGFVIAIFSVFSSWIIPWFPYHLFSDEVYNIVVVNAPESFVKYNESTQAARDQEAQDYGDRYNYFRNSNITSFEYSYDGYGWTEFVYKETDALYDFVTFGEWMRDNDAYLTVVFPSNFDKLIDDRQNGLTDIKPEILTYYRTNSMEYSAMKDGFINEYLSGYQSQIRADYGLLITSVEDSEILDYPIATRDMEYGFKAVTQNLNRTFVPILLFIILLYTSMSIGTNVIAGQKERGTFTGILLTPMPRYNIVLGYLLGVVLKAMIPAGIAAFIIELLTFNFSITCLLAIMLYLLVLELFIASLTIMISVINDTVVSAQTAFLPIFLVLVSVCVTCIQSAQDRLEFYLYLPVHGQFYGIGDAYNGTVDPAALASSSFLTLIIAVIAIVVAVRLLYSERYTVSVETIKDRDMSKRGIGYFIEKLNKSTDHFNYIITEIFYPLFTLSFYQFLAMIPVVVSYMRKAEYSSYIQDLANVGTVSDIITKSFEVISIFFTDPLYLGLMTVGYVAIIIHYIVHSKRFFKIKKFKDTCAKVGYPLTSGKRIATHYLSGLVIGFAMLSATVGIMYATGQITFAGFNLNMSGIGVFLLNLLMWIPQGASEEIMFRGYMIPAFANRYKRVVAVAVSSILFSAFHSLNKGYTPLASVNLALIAVLFALIYFLTDDIWMTSAIHTAWNLTQGNIYGLQVSGNNAANSVIMTVYDKNYSALITGGDFGPEGGLAVTIVTAACIIIVSILLARKTIKAKK